MVNRPFDLAETFIWLGTRLNFRFTYSCKNDQLTPVTLAIPRRDILSSKSLSMSCFVSAESVFL